MLSCSLGASRESEEVRATVLLLVPGECGLDPYLALHALSPARTSVAQPTNDTAFGSVRSHLSVRKGGEERVVRAAGSGRTIGRDARSSS